VPAPAFNHDLSLAERVKNLPVQQLVSEPGIEALDMNSGSLSERMCPSTPRWMNSSARTSMTSIYFSLRRTRIARLSWVNSSITLSIRYFLPSCVRSSTKS